MDIVEKVAMIIGKIMSDERGGYKDAAYYADMCTDEARAAIKATLEHLRDNVSDKAAFSGMLAIIGDKMDYGSDPDDAKACFRAMMVQTMKEME